MTERVKLLFRFAKHARVGAFWKIGVCEIVVVYGKQWRIGNRRRFDGNSVCISSAGEILLGWNYREKQSRHNCPGTMAIGHDNLLRTSSCKSLIWINADDWVSGPLGTRHD